MCRAFARANARKWKLERRTWALKWKVRVPSSFYGALDGTGGVEARETEDAPVTSRPWTPILPLRLSTT